MHLIRTIYKCIRGVVFTAIILVAVVYLLLYVLLAVPAFQEMVKKRAQEEASRFLTGDVRIGTLQIKPFNEMVMNEVEVFGPDGQRCLAIEKLGAGISLWTLLKERVIEITYGEIIGLDARIVQSAPEAPLNISFIIDAFKPKDKNKSPTQFNLKLRNVVIRRSVVAYDRAWLPRKGIGEGTDFNHLRLWDVKADLNLPEIANDDFSVDLRRLSFKLSGGLNVEKLALRAHITPMNLSLKDFILQLSATELHLPDIELNYEGYGGILKALAVGEHNLEIERNPVTPADFSWLVPGLSRYPDPLYLTLNLHGNLDTVTSAVVEVANEDNAFSFYLRGEGENLRDRAHMMITAEDLKVRVPRSVSEELTARLPKLDAKVGAMLKNVGNVDLSATGKGEPGQGNYTADLHLATSCGDLLLSVVGKGIKIGKEIKDVHGHISAEAMIDGFDLGRLIEHQQLGKLTGNLVFEGSLAGKKDINGEISANIEDFAYEGRSFTDINLRASKEGKDMHIILDSDNAMADMTVEAEGRLDKENSIAMLQADIRRIATDYAPLVPAKFRGYTLTGAIDANLSGNNPDNILGRISLADINLVDPKNRLLKLNHLDLTAEEDTVGKTISLDSDWISGEMRGDFKLSHLSGETVCMLSKVLPCLVKCPTGAEGFTSDVSFNFKIEADNTLPEFFNLPVRLLVPVPISGTIDATSNMATLQIDVPYLQQGKNKLIRATSIASAMDAESGTLHLTASTTMPVKKGEMKLDLQVFGQDDNIFTDVIWGMIDNPSFSGEVSLGASLSKNELTSKPEVLVELKPSVFDFGPARWNIEKAGVAYHDNTVEVEGLKIWHDDQFVEIDGTASPLPGDTIAVKLASIDVGYIFDILNINYVSFGGTATGEVHASGAMSKAPVAKTDHLRVENLSYNGTVLGDAQLRSSWNNEEKMVAIGADIKGDGGRISTVDGGIWVTRDSLSFDINADRVPVGFLGTFMSAFASDIKGRASGNAKLFGTFSDIDLVGGIMADSISMKLDFTNVAYHGSDSVYFEPGRIVVPSFRLYDRNGHSALLSGELTHRYFHDPKFTFRVSDVSRMLCYDTNAQLNPDWYGTLYGTGSAVVRGVPGLVGVSVDMSLVDNSTFTFVLNDRQAAQDYKFLTFTDKRKEAAEKQKADEEEDILSRFRKQVAVAEDIPSKFQMDIRASVSPSTLMTLVMDPVAGDKITARGNGNIQVDYDTESDEMQMFGKYTLEEGNYNFSLQDLILRDFRIRQGSSIAFNGDPLNAMLDITASYRVNTNLSDLDKSFSTDRDLARTNVPVDAMLMVEGPMQQPEISFDIELPTLTQDVERKVKSIISTDDMMSRQIIYLLALNRFSTPEYMGASSNGGELAAVASSTLSSQLSNMLGQLTDKFSLAPSFRSDKGDFSDLEVDVALSSRLLNNRLLINGNFGYRDRATSQTTFVGDFDIEYLLRRGGNLRLKAYNHFNDQNYYLRQALTTQGLGIIYRKEFDNPFSAFRKRRNGKDAEELPNVNHEDEPHQKDEDPHSEEKEIKSLEEEEPHEL